MPELDASIGDLPSSSALPPITDIAPAVRDASNIPVREGLPASYRMRADAHYVDELGTPPSIFIQMLSPDQIEAADDDTTATSMLMESIARHGVLEPLLVQKRDKRYRLLAGRRRLAAARALSLREVPCVVRRLTDEEVRALAGTRHAGVATAPPEPRLVNESELAARLNTALSCTTLLADGVPSLTRDVAVDMIRVEAQRTICALGAAEVLNGASEVCRPVPAPGLIKSLVDAIMPEVRLRGIRLVTHVEVPEHVVVDGDDRRLSATLTGAVLMLTAGLGDLRGARLDITLARDAQGAVLLRIAQESVILPSQSLANASSQTPTIERATAPLLALRREVESCGGTFAIARLPRGTQIEVMLPAFA